jgi:hypothetical protein
MGGDPAGWKCQIGSFGPAEPFLKSSSWADFRALAAFGLLAQILQLDK